MKKSLIVLLFLIASFIGAYSQEMSTAAFVNGYWTNWEKQNYYVLYSLQKSFDIRMQYDSLSETFSGFEFTKHGEQPWNWCFKLEVDNYTKPDKKERKQHRKDNTWYEYSGWVEYYVNDDFPTISKVLEFYRFPKIEPRGETARAKRRARVTIRICPYKKEPSCLNIFFDNVGVAISFNKLPFDKSYFVK